MLCVRDCVSGVWRVVDGKPEPLEPSLCNLCSHCIAVCPKDAIIHSRLDAAQAKKADKKRLDAASYRETVLTRRSVRQYRDKPVQRETIEKIIDLARYSPTASNDQNVAYIAVTDTKLIEKTAATIFKTTARLFALTKKQPVKALLRLAGLDKNRYLKVMDFVMEETRSGGRDFLLHNAPVLLVLHAPPKASFAADNCAIAATNIMNYAHTLGLGSCYIGLLTLALAFSKKLRRSLGVPDSRKVFACLVLGHPAYGHAKTVSRKTPDITWR
jgi:nitroreductase